MNGMPFQMNGGMPNPQQHVQKQNVPSLQIVILAGGRSKRMNSGVIPKVLCKVRGKEMLIHILEEVGRVQCDSIFIIVNEESAPLIQAVLAKSRLIVLSKVQFVLQRDVNGTGGALQCVLPHLDKNKYTLVLNGDMPNVKAELMGEFVKKNMEENSEMGIVSALLDHPADYGRVLRKNDRSKDRSFWKIVEKKDCVNAEELENREINAGIYYFSNIVLHLYLPKISNNNKSGEYYLTSIFDEIRKKEDNEIIIYQIPREMNNQILGINTHEELVYAERNY
jgi:bifunctional UDP-N-acetylglucosamine pyrophosphorylase/glucosamine-1-phosphate N-acetyltransferase